MKKKTKSGKPAKKGVIKRKALKKLPSAVLVGCSDGRFATAKKGFVKKVLGGYRGEDIFMVAGGIHVANPIQLTKQVVGKSESCNSMADSLRVLLQKHPIKKVIIVTHGGCAGYKVFFAGDETNLKKISSQQIKHAIHRNDEWQKLFPKIKFVTYFLESNGKHCKYKKIAGK